jgi:hypothetical protein
MADLNSAAIDDAPTHRFGISTPHSPVCTAEHRGVNGSSKKFCTDWKTVTFIAALRNNRVTAHGL